MIEEVCFRPPIAIWGLLVARVGFRHRAPGARPPLGAGGAGGRPGTARWLCRPQMIVAMQCHAGMPVKCPQLRWQGCGPGRAAHGCPAGRRSPGPSTALLIGGEGHQYRYKSSAVTQCLSTSPLPQSRESHALCRCGRRKRGRATPTDRQACARRRDTLDQWGSTEVMQHRNSKQSRLAPPLVETAGVKPESAEARGLGHFAAGPQG